MIQRVIARILASLTRDWALKLTALALAFLLWTSVRADALGQWQADIAISVSNSDPDWVVVPPPSPPLVSVTFRGPNKELLRAAADRPEIVVQFDEVDDSVLTRPINRSWVRMPPGTEQVVVMNMAPADVRVAFDRVVTRLLPVAATLGGQLPAGFELAGAATVEPGVVRASGAGRTLARIDSLRLPLIDLRDRRATDTIELTIDTTGTGLLITPRSVRVVVPIRSVLTDSSTIPFSPPPAPGPRG